MRVKDLATLGLTTTPTLAELKAAYHKLALEHHPDHGGDAAKLQAVVEAYDRVKESLEIQAERCGECHGTRIVMVTRGFTTLKLRCPGCKGTGKS